jgi:hypothetical protein
VSLLVYRILRDFIRSGLIAPEQTTHKALSVLLNEEDPEEKNRLTEQWRDHKLAELNFIGVVVR